MKPLIITLFPIASGEPPKPVVSTGPSLKLEADESPLYLFFESP